MLKRVKVIRLLGASVPKMYRKPHLLNICRVISYRSTPGSLDLSRLKADNIAKDDDDIAASMNEEDDDMDGPPTLVPPQLRQSAFNGNHRSTTPTEDKPAQIMTKRSIQPAPQSPEEPLEQVSPADPGSPIAADEADAQDLSKLQEDEPIHEAQPSPGQELERQEDLN